MRVCPDCSKPLLGMKVKAAKVKKCVCGGVWLPHGELEKLLGEVKGELLGGETSRRCPDCTLTMTPVVLPGGVPVETCSACRGTWLEWSDVVDLGVKELEAAVRPAPAERYAPFVSPEEKAAPSTSGFLCAKCSTRTEFAKGHGTASGLVCGACVANIQPMPRVPDLISALPDLDLDDV